MKKAVSSVLGISNHEYLIGKIKSGDFSLPSQPLKLLHNEELLEKFKKYYETKAKMIYEKKPLPVAKDYLSWLPYRGKGAVEITLLTKISKREIVVSVPTLDCHSIAGEYYFVPKSVVAKHKDFPTTEKFFFLCQTDNGEFLRQVFGW